MAKRKKTRKTKRRRLVKKTVVDHVAGTITHDDKIHSAGYATPAPSAKDFLFYDKNFVDGLKNDSFLEKLSIPKSVPQPGDPGWQSYNVKFTVTPPPNRHVFSEKDVFDALEKFGNEVIDIFDASLTSDRQRSAMKKLVIAAYERGQDQAKKLSLISETNKLRFFSYPITPSLKNTEDTNASIHTS